MISLDGACVRACVRSRRRSREIGERYRCTHVLTRTLAILSARACSLEKISVQVATRLDDETDIGSSERRAWRTKLEGTI